MAENTSRRSRAREQRDAAPPVADDVQAAVGQTPPSVAADENAAAAAVTPLAEDDSARVKVPREALIRNAARWLGVAPHVVIGALHEDDRQELTLGAARKAVERFQGKTTVEED